MVFFHARFLRENRFLLLLGRALAISGAVVSASVMPGVNPEFVWINAGAFVLWLFYELRYEKPICFLINCSILS
jgi:ferric iron reductase protein FhuF